MKEESMGEELRRVCCYVGNFWQKESGWDESVGNWLGWNEQREKDVFLRSGNSLTEYYTIPG